MAVVNVTEDLPSGSGRFDEVSRTYQRYFIVETDTFADNAITVLNAPGLPRYYEYFQKGNDFDYQSVVRVIDPRRDAQNPLIWRVRIEYRTITGDSSGGVPGDSATITYALPQWNVTTEIQEEVIWESVNAVAWGGDPALTIKNTAGDWFSPLPTRPVRIKVFTCRLIFRTYSAVVEIQTYNDKCNLTTYWGVAPGYLKIEGDFPGDRQADQLGTYWETNLVIKYHPKGWDYQPLNMGFNEKVDVNGKIRLQRIRDENNQYVTTPQHLDKTTGRAIWLDPTAGPPPAPLSFTVNDRVDFSTLVRPDDGSRALIPPLDVAF